MTGGGNPGSFGFARDDGRRRAASTARGNDTPKQFGKNETVAIISPGLDLMADWSEALSFTSKLLDVVRDWRTRRSPRRTLIIVPRDVVPPFIGPSFWSVATFPASPEKRGMSVNFRFCLRNIAKHPVRVVQSRLRVRPHYLSFVAAGGTVIEGRCLTEPQPGAQVFGSDHPILPGVQAVQASAFWLVEPAVAADGESFRAKVCLVDDFGNEHWTKKLTFRPLPAAPPASEPGQQAQ